MDLSSFFATLMVMGWRHHWTLITEEPTDNLLEHAARSILVPTVVQWNNLEKYHNNHNSCDDTSKFALTDLARLNEFAGDHPDLWTEMVSRNDVYIVLDYNETDPESFPPTNVGSRLYFIRDGENTTCEVFSNSIWRPGHERQCGNQQGIIRAKAQVACTNQDGRLCDPTQGLWERRRDLGGLCVRAGQVYDGLNEDNTLFRHIFSEAQAMLNFTHEPEVVADGVWGTVGRDGNFTGLVGYAQRGEVDIGIDTLEINLARSMAADFSVPVVSYTYRIHVKTPKAYKTHDHDPLGLAHVFKLEAWTAIAVTCLILSFVHAVYFVMEKNGRSDLANDVLDGIAIVLKAIVLEAHCRLSTWMPGKIMAIFTMMMGTVCFAFYTGGFLSHLAIYSQKEPPIDSFEDLLESDYDVGTNRNSSLQEMFESAIPGSVMREIWERKMAPKYVEVMHHGNSNFKENLETADNLASFALAFYSCDCSVMATGPQVERQTGFIFPKGSPFRHLFDNALQSMRESGVLHRLDRDHSWQALTTNCTPCFFMVESTEGVAMSLNSLWGLFAALAIGAGIAATIAMAEAISATIKRFSA